MTYSAKAEIARKNRAFLREVRSSSEARLAARLVLDAIIAGANMYDDPPHATITKTQIIIETCLCLRSVKTALQILRAEGSIYPTQGIEGGNGVAVTYSFRVVGQGADDEGDAAGEGQLCGQWWKDALTVLREENRDLTLAWFVPLSPVEISATRAVLRAPTAFVRSYLQRKPELTDAIKRALAGRAVEIV